jgi:hypothetical protein
MAVTVIPAGKQWYDYLAEAGTDLLGGFIKNQFDKSAEKRKYQMEQDAAAAEMARKQEMADWQLGRFNEVPDMSVDRVGYQNAMLKNGMINSELTPEIDTITQAIYPPKTLTNVNLGDRNQQTVFDPVTGAIQQAVQEYGLNPTDVFKENAATRRTGITAAATKYGHDRDYERSIAEIKGRGDVADITAETNRYGYDRAYQGTRDEINAKGRLTPADLIELLVALQGDGYRAPMPGAEKLGPLVLKTLENVVNPHAAEYDNIRPYEPNPVYRPGDWTTEDNFRRAAQDIAPGVDIPSATPGASALPPGITEQEVATMMEKSGKSRNQVIAFLEKWGRIQ